MQQLDCMQFVMSMDHFLSQFFGLQFGKILDACIKDPRLTFVMDIDPPETMRESEAACESRANMAKERARNRRKERYAACLENLRQRYASMTPEQ